MACRSLPVVSEPILPSGTAPTLFCSALMSEVDSDPSASTPIHSCRARVVAGPNLPSTTSAPEFCPPDDPPESELEPPPGWARSEEHTSELQSRGHLVCRLLLEKKNNNTQHNTQPERNIVRHK